MVISSSALIKFKLFPFMAHFIDLIIITFKIMCNFLLSSYWNNYNQSNQIMQMVVIKNCNFFNVYSSTRNVIESPTQLTFIYTLLRLQVFKRFGTNAFNTKLCIICSLRTQSTCVQNREKPRIHPKIINFHLFFNTRAINH